MDTRQDFLTFTDLGTALVRSRRLLAAGAVVGLLLGLAVGVVLPPTYEAVAVVRIGPGETGSTPRPDMAAEESVAQSRRVASAAADLLQDPTLSALQVERSLHVTAVESSSVLRIRYSAGDATQSARGADAVAHAYLAVRSIDEMERAARLDERLSREIRLADTPTRHTLRAERARLVLSDLGGGEIVDPARIPASSSTPGPAMSAVGGLVLGLLLTTPLAALRLRRTTAAGAS